MLQRNNIMKKNYSLIWKKIHVDVVFLHCFHWDWDTLAWFIMSAKWRNTGNTVGGRDINLADPNKTVIWWIKIKL